MHGALCIVSFAGTQPQVGKVCHPGYVAIMPFLLRLLDPDSARLGELLDVVGDPSQLW